MRVNKFMYSTPQKIGQAALLALIALPVVFILAGTVRADIAKHQATQARHDLLIGCIKGAAIASTGNFAMHVYLEKSCIDEYGDR